VDIHDSLHSCRLGGELVWNGINEALRAGHPDYTARLKHETWTRSDALLEAEGLVPETVSRRKLSLGSYPATSQFSRAIFEAKTDAIVLSIQPDVTNQLLKHKSEGFLLDATDSQQWSAEDKEWLKSDFDFLGLLEVEDAMKNFAAIIEKIRERSDAAILIYNMSPIVPGETIHCHQGMGESYSTRIRTFNLGLIELSVTTGISIIDVDSLVARKGAEALKLDAVHLTPQGYQLIAGEVVRVLSDLGVLDEEKS
jgi:lysophospholipase L1-like esterase